jgi:hypothetical protein
LGRPAADPVDRHLPVLVARGSHAAGAHGHPIRRFPRTLLGRPVRSALPGLGRTLPCNVPPFRCGPPRRPMPAGGTSRPSASGHGPVSTAYKVGLKDHSVAPVRPKRLLDPVAVLSGQCVLSGHSCLLRGGPWDFRKIDKPLVPPSLSRALHQCWRQGSRVAVGHRVATRSALDAWCRCWTGEARGGRPRRR